MDDIARHLGLSKKTIYLHFKNKDEIVLDILNKRLLETKNFCCNVSKNVSNAIDQVLSILNNTIEMMRSINMAMLFDLKKYHNHVYLNFEEFKITFIKESLKENIEKGRVQGLYRLDFDVEIIVQFYISMLEVVFNISNKKQMIDYEYQQKEMVLYHLHGICNTKGVNYLNKKIKKIYEKK